MFAFARVSRCAPLLARGYLASLVSYRVLNYPMVALIPPDTFLIVSLDEGEIEEKKGERGRAAGKGKEGTATSAEPGTSVSGAHIWISTLLFRNVFVYLFLSMFFKGLF